MTESSNGPRERRMMRLGLFLHGEGHHVAAWRDPNVFAGATQNFEHYANAARLAEHGCFDMLFNADSQSTFGPDDIDAWKRTTAAVKLEPITLFSALAVVTKRIGLVCTSSTTYNDPFHVARFFASMDRLSNGRAGWNLVTSSAASEAYNFSYDEHVPHAERYVRAREFAEVVFGLWDSWDEDAYLGDKASGLFFDAGKLHLLNHKGRYFKVRGPLTVMRSEQARPVVVQAGQSEDGRELAAATAEVLFTVQQDVKLAQAFYADVKRRVAAHGRVPDSILVMPGVLPVIGRTEREAREKFEALQALIHPELGISVLSEIVNLDLSPFDLDGPLPDAPTTNRQQGRQQVVYDMARKENLSIRKIIERVVGARAHRIVCGTASQVADAMEEWFSSGACDGFNVLPLTIPQGLEDIVNELLPELRRRGLFRNEYEGATLRENLGLPRPVSRYAR
ncbi:MAG: LLM class flavin-dependent oxidoreductase [Burkholderiales bacterium]